jgi:hypothetical protein
MKEPGQIRYPLRYLLVSAVAWLMGLGFLAFIAFLIWKIFFEDPGPLLTPYWYEFDQTLADVVHDLLPWQLTWVGSPIFVVVCICLALGCLWVALWYFRKA